MSKENKLRLLFSALGLMALYGVVLGLTYFYFKSYAIAENEAKLNDLLMHNKALHTYVENTLKPVVYELQAQGHIPKEYFNPKILSFTYMSRNIMDEYNNQRNLQGLEPIRYKLASNNPRNQVNLANDKEKLILKEFADGSIDKYHEHLQEGDKSYIYYALPATKNKESCMHCHGDPADAPKHLIELYGDKAGFHEVVGQQRAFISVTMPLDTELFKVKQQFKDFALSLFVLLLLVYGVIAYLIAKLDLKDKKLLELAEQDGLTHILNRHVFEQELQTLIQTQPSHDIALLIFDIDFFKKVNDTYGHLIGDQVLITITQTIMQHIRSSDRFYRIGGEEFALLLQTQKLDDVVQFAQRLRETIAHKKIEQVNYITISIGLTLLRPNDTLESFYLRADQALYEAKKSGRNLVKVK